MTLDPNASLAVPSPQPGTDNVLHQLLAAQQQQMHQQQLALASLATTQQQLQQQLQQQQQQQQQQAPTVAAHRIAATIGDLQAFTGRGSSVAALQWLHNVEYRFAAAEALLSVAADSPQGAAARLLSVTRAFTEDADRWFTTLPNRPGTWADFKDAFKRRFVSVATTDAKLSELQRLTASMQRIREKLNVDGIRRYATQFQQLAREVPDSIMSEYLKRKAFADGLPQKHAEYVLSKNRSSNPPTLHALVDDVVLARALDRALSSAATMQGNASSGDDMQIDAISLCATQFGIPHDEARRYLEPQEGWSMHDTHRDDGPNASAAAAGAGSSSGRSQTSGEDLQTERLLAAFESRFGSALSGSGKSQSQRRNVPSDLSKEVPQELANARKEAGLCIKCGITKYEPGGKGHNSRTCKLPVNKSLSASEGRKKANF